MFSSALKSFTSNISANYQLSPNPITTSGPWKIFDGKKKSTNKPVSVFVFDRKALEVRGGGLRDRSSATSLRKAQDEAVERLKKEASSLAKLRHPNILELAEPVEETRNGGLMFATEPITASLAGVLQEKDDQERAGGVGGRPSRYVVEDSDGNRRRRDLDLDELEIQKGLLQVSKGLEFLHESAGLVHGNLTPDAIYINTKSDWKISGLAFAGPADGSTTHSSLLPIALSEVLHYDPRLPRSVQLNLDFTSPDFVLDSNVTASADLFSLGLLIIALYHFPHTSPIQTNETFSMYKKLFSSPSTIPSQNNDFLSSRPLPKDLTTYVLPRLITRRPAQRMTTKEFQQSQYFDNVMVSTMRFLDELPAKTPNEKSQFMRGLPRVLSQFPNSVLEKKVLTALLDETKDKEILSLVLQNVFKIVAMLPVGKRPFTEKVIPKLREIFLTSVKKPTEQERDTSKEAGLMVVLENMSSITGNCSAKDFKDDILPILLLGIESPTHSITDATLGCLPIVLPVLDFSTVKHDLFPVVASMFSKTSSLSIKVKGLEALGVLCGASHANEDPETGFSEVLQENMRSKATPGISLDKYTVQEKVVPLLKAIKTREPAVMMAALGVFQQVGKIADSDFLALEVLPTLWSFSLGPLLELDQFQRFIKLIKAVSSKIEQEQIKKLQGLSSASANGNVASRNRGHSSQSTDTSINGGDAEGDFEQLVLGRRPGAHSSDPFDDQRDDAAKTTKPHKGPSFSWASTDTTASLSGLSHGTLSPQPRPDSRSITPDHYSHYNNFPALEPTANMTLPASAPLQSSTANRANPGVSAGRSASNYVVSNSSLATLANARNANAMSASHMQPMQPASTTSPFSILPPPPTPNPLVLAPNPSASFGSFAMATPLRPGQSPSPINLPYGAGLGAMNASLPSNITGTLAHPQQKHGLDKYESLL